MLLKFYKFTINNIKRNLLMDNWYTTIRTNYRVLETLFITSILPSAGMKAGMKAVARLGYSFTLESRFN